MLRKPLGQRFGERAAKAGIASRHARTHCAHGFHDFLVFAAMAAARGKLDRVHPLLFLAEVRLGMRDEVIERRDTPSSAASPTRFSCATNSRCVSSMTDWPIASWSDQASTGSFKIFLCGEAARISALVGRRLKPVARSQPPRRCACSLFTGEVASHPAVRH